MCVSVLVVLGSVPWRGYVFFLQEEDPTRDDLVTGVQTWALPIYLDVFVLPAAGGIAAVPKLATLPEARDLEPLEIAGKSDLWGKSVDLGGRRIIKKKKALACSGRGALWVDGGVLRGQCRIQRIRC